MKVGIIGAGKVGFSMGRYLVENGIELTGYFSKSKESSLEASNFTKSKSYQKLADIVRDSEVLFITVPDDMIGVIWEQIKELNVSDKIFCHCSGVLSADLKVENHGSNKASSASRRQAGSALPLGTWSPPKSS